MNIKTHSEQETQDFGRKLAAVLGARDVVFLSGELGSGKTQVVKGMASQWGVDSNLVGSPAFDLIHEYIGDKMTLYHMDFYRLGMIGTEEHEWIREYTEKGGVLAIEWAENVPNKIFPEYLELHFADYEPGNDREIAVSGVGERYQSLVSELEKVL